MFLPGFLRIPFFPESFEGIFHRNVVLERSQEFLFFLLSQEIFTGIPVGQEFLYLPQNCPDSEGFCRIPVSAKSCWLWPATKKGSLLSSEAAAFFSVVDYLSCITVAK